MWEIETIFTFVEFCISDNNKQKAITAGKFRNMRQKSLRQEWIDAFPLKVH